jgi:hypothetical protein
MMAVKRSAAGFLPSGDSLGVDQGCCAEKRLLAGSMVHSKEASGGMASNWSTS